MFRNKKVGILESFKKAHRVIQSCENQVHIDGARNYINNFLVSHSKSANEWVDGRSLLHPNEFAEVCYHRLRESLSNKEKQLG